MPTVFLPRVGASKPHPASPTTNCALLTHSLTYSSNNPYPFPSLSVFLFAAATIYSPAQPTYNTTKQAGSASLRFKFFRQSNLALEELVPPKFLPKRGRESGSESRGKRDIDSQSGAALPCCWEWEHITLSCRFSPKDFFRSVAWLLNFTSFCLLDSTELVMWHRSEAASVL